MNEQPSAPAGPAPATQGTNEPLWPKGTPWTVHFPQGDGYVAADLEYAAPLPRAGDIVEYIDERAQCHRFRVKEVIHTLQSSAAGRPVVAAAGASPQSIARVDGQEAERPGDGGVVRSGLPKVILERVEDEDQPR